MSEPRVRRVSGDWRYVLGFGLCWAGVGLLVLSLFLPAEPSGTRGWFALLVGFYWYPSNLALILAPLVGLHRNGDVRLAAGVFLLLSCVGTWLVVIVGGGSRPATASGCG